MTGDLRYRVPRMEHGVHSRASEFMTLACLLCCLTSTGCRPARRNLARRKRKKTWWSRGLSAYCLTSFAPPTMMLFWPHSRMDSVGQRGNRRSGRVVCARSPPSHCLRTASCTTRTVALPSPIEHRGHAKCKGRPRMQRGCREDAANRHCPVLRTDWITTEVWRQ